VRKQFWGVGMGLALLAGLCSAKEGTAKAAGVDSTAKANLTVHCRFHFMNGDTLTRPVYYGDGRTRMTMSDGNEVIYDLRSKDVIYLDHLKRRYWKGPLDRANAIVDSLTQERYQSVMNASEEKRQEWAAYVNKFNDNLRTESFEYIKKIAGKECDGHKISVGKLMVHTRWITREIALTDYVKDMEGILLLPTVDPVGRSIVRLIANADKGSGLTLAATTEINTPTQKGKFSWEAYWIDTRPIAAKVWEIPEGYQEVKL
jgi:hypothetical protein